MPGNTSATPRDWPRLQRARNKFLHELTVFVLGGGYSVILLIFWPGWLLVAIAFGALWKFWAAS